MKKSGAETKADADKVSVGTFDPLALILEDNRGGYEKMPKRRRIDYRKPEKTYWHIYSLKNLN